MAGPESWTQGRAGGCMDSGSSGERPAGGGRGWMGGQAGGGRRLAIAMSDIAIPRS